MDSPQNNMNCQKPGHNNKTLTHFQFSEDVNQIFLCEDCNLENTNQEEDEIIEIENLITIQNPQEIIQNRNEKERIQQNILLMECDIYEKIGVYHDQALVQLQQTLENKKQESIKKVNEYFTELTQSVPSKFEVDKLRDSMSHFVEGSINIQEFYQKQLILKNKYKQQIELIENKMDYINMKSNELNKQISDIFSDFEHQIGEAHTKFNQMLKEKPDISLNEKEPQEKHKFLPQISISYHSEDKDNISISKKIEYDPTFDQDVILPHVSFKCPNTQSYKLIYLNQSIPILQQKQFDEPEITNSDEDQCILSNKLQSIEEQKQVENHIFKFYINYTKDCQGIQELCYLSFQLISKSNCNSKWGDDNWITFSGKLEDSPGHSSQNCEKKGQEFQDFWQSYKSVLNVKINMKNKSFEMYDDDKKAYFKLDIDTDKFRDKTALLGIQFQNTYNVPLDLTLLDYISY